jgi:hypothetical protein
LLLGLAATGNSNFGYFAGGNVPFVVSTINRIDYSNDTATASARGALTVGGFLGTASTNARSS